MWRERSHEGGLSLAWLSWGSVQRPRTRQGWTRKAFKLGRGGRNGRQTVPTQPGETGHDEEVGEQEVSRTEVPQLMLPTTEDREDLASAHRAAQEEEVVQLLHEQQQIVVTTDAVSEDGDAATDVTSAQEAERCHGPTSVSEAGGAQVENAQPQVQQFNWSPNQALTMVVPVWVGRRKIMAVVDTAAQVTLINRRLSQELGCEDPVERVQLRNAQMD